MDLDLYSSETTLENMVVRYKCTQDEEVMAAINNRLSTVIAQRAGTSSRKERAVGFHAIETDDLQQELRWLLIHVVRDYDSTMGVPFIALFQRCATNHLNSLFNVRHKNLNSRVSYECTGLEIEVTSSNSDDGSGLKLSDILHEKGLTPSEQCSVDSFLEAFQADFWVIVNTFGARTHRIFDMLVNKKMRVKEIAAVIGISGARVSQLVKETYDKARTDLDPVYKTWLSEMRELKQEKGVSLSFGG